MRWMIMLLLLSIIIITGCTGPSSDAVKVTKIGAQTNIFVDTTACKEVRCDCCKDITNCCKGYCFTCTEK